MTNESLARLALSLSPGIGRQRQQELLRHYGDAQTVLQLPRKELTQWKVPPETILELLNGCAMRRAQHEAESAARKKVQILTAGDLQYPERLRQIYDPPIVLYVLGSPLLLNDASVALVGSRRCSPYGREVTRRLARELAALGLTIVSGMARGIDSHAHWGALEAKGRTIAVLGNGVDRAYPRENSRLYRRIEELGCLVSEFPLESYPAPQNFPIRNRIISGLSLGTIIAEASEFSGSLSTARLTLEQGRELWAVPGNITQPGSYGPNYLIKQGAPPLLDAQDVLEQLPVHVLETLRPVHQSATGSTQPASLSREETMVLKLLSVDQPLLLDEIAEKSGLPVGKLHETLFQLEVAGLVIQAPGQLFSRRLS